MYKYTLFIYIYTYFLLLCFNCSFIKLTLMVWTVTAVHLRFLKNLSISVLQDMFQYPP